MVYFTTFPSPLGPLRLTSDGSALTGLYMQCQTPDSDNWLRRDSLDIFQTAGKWLEDYFAGNPRPVDFPIFPDGTPFQKQVWQLLATIAYGESTTYGTLAKRLSSHMSAQAVGQAVGKNPIAILIPCHRVLGAGRKLTGYAGGLDNKKWLLRHEGIHYSE